MRKLLFISNVGKKITNFSLSPMIAAQSLGYDFHMAANYTGFKDNASQYNVELHHIDLARNPFNLKNIRAYNQILSLIKEEKYDVIHCNTPIGGILGRLCGKKAKVSKIIYTVHGFHFYKGAPLINRTIFKWAELWLARYTDAIITINQEDFRNAQKFKLRKGGNVYYIPGVGVDTSLIKKAKSKRKEVLEEIGGDNNSILIISVGELNNNKNNRVIIEALGKLRNPNIHYLLCGLGEKKKELYSIVKEYNLEKNVHFLGYRDDIPELFKSSDIFVMPSYREGLSRALMEAMSAELPCIVSDIRGNKDLIEDNIGGLLIEPDDINGFMDAIHILSLDKNLRSTMGLNNLEKVRQFDIKNVRTEMQRIYEKELK